MNPLQEANRRAAEQLSAFLARFPGEIDLERRLVDLVEATIHKGTEGFCRQGPRARENPGLDPTWIPVVPAELFDRLEGAGLVRRDEKGNQWVWFFEWFGALLGLRALKRGSADAAAERQESWLSAASSTTAMGALSLLAEERFEEPDSSGLQPFLSMKIGISALAGAVALRAPADDLPSEAPPLEAGEAPALAAFAALLDRLFGLPQALGPASAKMRTAQILDRAETQLRGLEGVTGARSLLRRRLVTLLDSAAATAPRDRQVLRSLAKALVASAEYDGAAVEACDCCARALEVWQRLTRLSPAASADGGLRGLLHRISVCVIRLPQHGDPAPFAAIYAAAVAALRGLPAEASSREEELRQEVALLGRAIELKWEAKPGDIFAAFERALEIIEQLLEIAPTHRGYLEGKQELLEEFARLLEVSDPARAERLREKANQLVRRLPPASPREPSGELLEPESATSSEASESSPPYSSASRAVLRTGIAVAWSLAESDPIAAIAGVRRVVENLCRNVLANQMERPPGRPTFDDIVNWLKESKLLPERLHHQFVVLEWHFGTSLEELSSSSMFGSAPGVVCCAAMNRLARWYFETYLQTELPSEIGYGEPRAAAPGAPKLHLIAAPRFPLRAAPSGGEEADPDRRCGPTRLSARSAISSAGRGDGGLHPAQEAAARELGVPTAIEDPLTGMSMVLVPGGEVWVEEPPGDNKAKSNGERPRHRIHLRPFYCAVTPVLQDAWSRFMAHNPSYHLGPRLPVANVAWEEVQAFLDRANEDRTGPPLRLLREAEWYRAARAGSDSAYWWGSEYRPGWANCSDDGMGSGRQETSEPGQYPANPFGILDSFGNVWEWCQPFFSPAIKNVRAFGAAGDSESQGGGVLCGASWKSIPSELFKARHMKDPTRARFDDFGFRCGRDVE